jgi:hypothetical protein
MMVRDYSTACADRRGMNRKENEKNTFGLVMRASRDGGKSE